MTSSGITVVLPGLLDTMTNTHVCCELPALIFKQTICGANAKHEWIHRCALTHHCATVVYKTAWSATTPELFCLQRIYYVSTWRCASHFTSPSQRSVSLLAPSITTFSCVPAHHLDPMLHFSSVSLNRMTNQLTSPPTVTCYNQ